MKIGIIGLGLIGGSIFKNLKSNNKYEVVGVSSSVTEANVSKDYEILRGCNLIFVCTPMNATLDILKKLEDYTTSETIVTDVCSLKGFVSKKQYSYNFIPSHPMAGTENCGWKSSFPELFKGAKWVITPVGAEPLPEQDILESVISDMGAKIVITSAEEHDKAVALISHMPMIIAQALCLNIKNNKLAQTLAASGFRDTTRLALSNTTMASDMVNMNKENIRKSINSLIESVENLMTDEYKDYIEQIKSFRKNLYM